MKRAMRYPGWIGAAVLLGGPGCNPALEPSGEMQEVGELLPSGMIAEGPVSLPGRPIEFYRPLDLTVVGDSIYMIDNGNDHVVVLNRDLEVLGILGREGEGPGEYQQPISVRQSPSGVFVSDMGNNRFTELDREGTVLRTFGAPSGLQSFSATSAGSVVVPSRDGEHHFTRIDDGGREELGEWPWPPAPDEMNSVRAGFQDPSIAVTAGDTVHVFDERDGMLYKYTPTGELRLKKAIPSALRDSAMARLDRLVGGLAKQGMRVLGGSYTKGVSTLPEGGLILPIRTDQTYALLIDPGTYSMRRISMPVTTIVRPVFESSRAATVVDSVLYLLRDVSIYAFRLRPAK